MRRILTSIGNNLLVDLSDDEVTGSLAGEEEVPTSFLSSDEAGGVLAAAEGGV